LASVLDALRRMGNLNTWAASHPEFPALNTLLAGAPALDDLLSLLEISIDERGHVRDSADTAIPPLRKELARAEARRKKAMQEVLEQWSRQGLLQDTRPVLRGGRPTLAVKNTHLGRARGILHDRSNSGDTVYLEPDSVVEWSNQMASTESRLHQVIQRVLAECTRSFVRRRVDLQEADLRLGQADLAFAAAKWALELNAEWPEMPSESLRLIDARHPLLVRQLGFEEVTPLSIELGTDFDLLVVTGPNTGGKTVALKTVGLLSALSCAGLPVPISEGSAVPVFPGIDADIGDQQSLESSLSTFSGHLRKILRILEGVQRGSLVLLDELGTGTDPEEGSALGQSILERLLESQAFVMANTHLGSLKLFSVQSNRAENASMEFDPESLSPSFRLLVGVPGASHALDVAKTMGMPAPILERAESLGRRNAGMEDLIADAAGVRRHAEEIRERARGAEAEVRETLRSAEEQESAARFRAKLREDEAEMAFRDLRSRMEALLESRSDSLTGQMTKEVRVQFVALQEELRKVMNESDLAARWDTFLRGLKKGMTVWVPQYRSRMQVLKLDSKRGRIKLRHGQLDIELPIHEISWLDSP
jgi:DNA mismatch repair protein MutS2